MNLTALYKLILNFHLNTFYIRHSNSLCLYYNLENYFIKTFRQLFSFVIIAMNFKNKY